MIDNREYFNKVASNNGSIQSKLLRLNTWLSIQGGKNANRSISSLPEPKRCFINFQILKCRQIHLIPEFKFRRSIITVKQYRRNTFSRVICDRDFLKLTKTIYHIFLLYFLMSPLFSSLLHWDDRLLIRPVTGCRPGSYSSKRHVPRKLVPLVYRQHVPNVSEKTIGASGPVDGKTVRDSKRFREELKANFNTDIVFKDEERTGADRMMTQRCKDRLNQLAILVSEHWKNKVKLRVIEAWDEDRAHDSNSLHYEGRAVDITTSDRDRQKYGMLARLAVESGFDWVFYESRSHVHCSVKADKSDAAIYGGCFSGYSYVTRPDGRRIPMSKVQLGDTVLTLDSDGQSVPDKVIAFLHWTEPSKRTSGHLFTKIIVDNGQSITLTTNHLIKMMPADKGISEGVANSTYEHAFAYSKNVKRGDFLLGFNSSVDSDVAWHRVVSVKRLILHTGVYAPLTKSGTILVNGMLTSCYAAIESHTLAHLSMSPLRYYYVIKNWVFPDSYQENNEHIMWYCKLLFYIASSVFSESLISI